MHAFGMLKWTATILLVYISECRGQPSEVLRLADSLGKLKWAFEVLQAKNAHLETKMSLLWKERDNIDPSSGDGRKDPTGGVVYVRWGRKTCHGNATLLYSGIAGGSHYEDSGGGSNYQCLPMNPQWGHHTDDINSFSIIQGAEYEFFSPTDSPFLKTNFAGHLRNHEVPCAVCHVVERHAKVMIPAWNRCPDGWTREYNGYLTSTKWENSKGTFECMDEAPDVMDVTKGTSANHDGVTFLLVEAHCGHSLPCPNYVEERALTCVVCTK